MCSSSFKDVTRAISKYFVSNFISNFGRAVLGCVAHKFKVIPLHIHLRVIKEDDTQLSRKNHPGTKGK